jgi:hypothetical protein
MGGLVARRNDECALWREGVTDPAPIPSSVTREVDTSPTPTASAVTKDNTLWAKCVGAAATCGVAVKSISDTVAPYAAASPHVAQIVALLATVGAALAVAAMVFDHLKKKHA